ncbi:MAG: DNA polymerase/3'-5' exonuclease PolX [Pseudomonadota bacterium]
MDKHGVANMLSEVAMLLELKGENPFKVRAYENASRAIDNLTDDLAGLVAEGKLTSIKGIGRNIADHIAEIMKSGTFKEYDELRSKVPEGVVQILSIPGLGPKRVKYLWEELRIKSPGELEMVCKRHMIDGLPGFGEKMEKNILAGIESLKRFAGQRLFSDAAAEARAVHDAVKLWPEVARSEVAGSIRRRKEIVRDIDILVSTRDPAKVMDRFVHLPGIERVVQHGDTKSEVVLSSGIQCDLRAVKDGEYPFALHYFTGSKEHNVAMRLLAKKAGLKLNEYGLFRGASKKSIACMDEAGIFKALGLEYIEPELRENTGEIEAAAKAKLPKLVEEGDLKGVIHAHSNYTDGSASIEGMAKAARSLGYSYLAITDHSKAVTIAHGMKPADVKRQHKEIDALNGKLNGFRVLKGIEVDIMAGGELDFDDDILATFDIVIAAVHSRFGMNEKDMTDRIVKAISNPYVCILAHPTGRLLLAREGYAVDMKKVIDTAAGHGTAIEINAHPSRLDLDWRWCKYAKERGAKMAICPDAHQPEGLVDVAYGVGIARKGWLEKGDVLNCLGVDALIKHFRKTKG